MKLKAEIAALKRQSGAGIASASFSPQSQSDNNIQFKVTNVVGDKKNQTVTVTVVFTNSNANVASFNTSVSSFLDESGEEYKLKNSTMNWTTLYTDVAYKATYTFEGVLPKVAKIKILPMPYGNQSGKHVEGKVEFRDLSINWK